MKRGDEHVSRRCVHWFRTKPIVAAIAAAPAAISARLKRLGRPDSRARAGRRARTSAHTRAVAATACSESKINVSGEATMSHARAVIWTSQGPVSNFSRFLSMQKAGRSKNSQCR